MDGLAILWLWSSRRFDELETLLHQLLEQGQAMSAEMDHLREQVTRVNDRGDALITLVEGIAEQLKNAPDLATVQALADELKDQADQLGAAVDANTPNAPAPPAPTP